MESMREVPRGNLASLWRYGNKDLLSGFLVFLIALPLCLGIAAASGYPPIAGVFSAIIGGLLAPFLSNSELTIKGPAAGLIVIALGCVADFAQQCAEAGVTDPLMPYRMALGVGLAAGMLQIFFAVVRSGVLGEFFPASAVHGMLAAIGIIIIAKQVPIAVGVDNRGEPLELLREIPEKIAGMNPTIATIGGVSLAILFGLPLLGSKFVRRIPAPMVVVVAAVALGSWFDLEHEHHVYMFGGDHMVSEKFLVPVPNNMLAAVQTPELSGLASAAGWKWVIMFALIGSLESLLSAKAIDTLDPYGRKCSMDRDLLAVGVGNTLSACVGGLPMISEIVRSKANIDNGAKTRFANLFHGLFLLLFVALVPGLIHRIPQAALASMLVYTGFRLAAPREFINVYRIGREQFLVFTTTVVAVLATDLLIGIGIGIAVKLVIHINNAMPLWSLFMPQLSVEESHDSRRQVLRVRHFAVFSNWLLLRRSIMTLTRGHEIVVDLSETRLVDHTVMEKLHELEREFEHANRKLMVVGLDGHQSNSSHPHAARTNVDPRPFAVE